ncbi:hypothetical protein ACIP39_12175 [Streptomyces tibetensis]|uniref:hypothetical protein n=1 Tax=Streptomyces tibetensis TaxID=2382123 RepID=UPI0037FAB28B
MVIDTGGKIIELRGDAEAVLRVYEATRRGGTGPVAPAGDEDEPQRTTRQDGVVPADPEGTDVPQTTPARRITIAVVQGAALVGAAALLALAERIVGLLSG